MINKKSKIFLAGHNGMVGSAVLRYLKKNLYKNVITKKRTELDLFDNHAVKKFIKQNKFDIIICCAAFVGGIKANSTMQADFIIKNLEIQNNLIISAFNFKVKKFIFLGSSCIYPKNISKPIRENLMLKSSLEDTNEPYAVAKIAGLKLCEYINKQYGYDYRTIIPCNLYGPNDNFDTENSHVLAALLKKFHDSKINKTFKVNVWGSGRPKREFLHVDDLADGVIKVLKINHKQFRNLIGKDINHINIGSGNDVTINELALMVKKITGSKSKIYFDRSQPDGVKRKLLDISKMKKLNWKPKYTLNSGIKQFYIWYLESLKSK